MFEASVGSSYSGDIAIDDVLITDGACPMPGKNSVLIVLKCCFTWLFNGNLHSYFPAETMNYQNDGVIIIKK